MREGGAGVGGGKSSVSRAVLRRGLMLSEVPGQNGAAPATPTNAPNGSSEYVSINIIHGVDRVDVGSNKPPLRWWWSSATEDPCISCRDDSLHGTSKSFNPAPAAVAVRRNTDGLAAALLDGVVLPSWLMSDSSTSASSLPCGGDSALSSERVVRCADGAGQAWRSNSLRQRQNQQSKQLTDLPPSSCCQVVKDGILKCTDIGLVERKLGLN